MDDGIELAVSLWLPDAEGGPQPCLLEALPYRKDDITSTYADEYARLRDQYGYAVCRADVRGTGSSGGDAVDEYPAREQADLVALIDWLSKQDWCDGNVGMWGTSYSGFNSLQVACERPPALKAICAIYATDDRYTDDVHWRGGARKLLDLVDYCSYMTALNALPPLPALWGDGWREEWRRRVADQRALVADLAGRAHRRAVLAARLRAPGLQPDRLPHHAGRGLGRRLPEQLVPHCGGAARGRGAAPAAGRPVGARRPGHRAAGAATRPGGGDGRVVGPVAARQGHRGRPGAVQPVRPRSRPAPPTTSTCTRASGYARSGRAPASRRRYESWTPRPPYRVRPDVGTAAWIDCAGHLPWGPSGDQQADDAASLGWDWPAGEVVVMGHPVARLRLSADAATTSVSVKLCDVFADGTSALVSRGSRVVGPLQPGEVHDIEIELDACAYAFAPGQRLRLSVAGADWPNTVAPTGPATLTVHGGDLELPVWSGPSPHAPPEFVPGAEVSSEDPAGVVWRVEHDVLGRETACVVDYGSTFSVPGGEAADHYAGRVSVDTRTFTQRAEAVADYRVAWPDLVATTRSTLDVGIGPDAYDVVITLEARESRVGDTGPGELVGERRWERRLPR